MVKVIWLDHSTYDHTGWKSEQDLKDLMGGVAVVSYGVLLFEDDNSIILASTLGDNEAFAGEFCILKGTIKKIKTIEKITKKKD